AKQLAIQRRQALAQSLMESGQSDPGRAAFGGIRNAGNMLLGAMLAKHADQDMADLYSPQGSDTGQITNTAVPSAAQPMQQAQPQLPPGVSGSADPRTQALGAALNPASVQPQPPQAPTSPRTIPSVMSAVITTLPGMTPQQSMMEFYTNNGAYWK